MARKISRSGKKKRSQYQMSASERAKTPVPISPADKERERRRTRINFIALGVLTISLILILFAPKFDSLGLPYEVATGIAYICTTIAAGFMLYSLKYTRKERQTTTRITGYLMLFVGIFGFIITVYPFIGK